MTDPTVDTSKVSVIGALALSPEARLAETLKRVEFAPADIAKVFAVAAPIGSQ